MTIDQNVPMMRKYLRGLYDFLDANKLGKRIECGKYFTQHKQAKVNKEINDVTKWITENSRHGNHLEERKLKNKINGYKK